MFDPSLRFCTDWFSLKSRKLSEVRLLHVLHVSINELGRVREPGSIEEAFLFTFLRLTQLQGMKRRQKGAAKAAGAEKKTKQAPAKPKGGGRSQKGKAPAFPKGTKPEFKLKHNLLGHQGAVSSAKFARDGTLLGSASADKTVKIWNAVDGKFQCELVGHTGGVSDLSWVDSSQLATASDDRTVMIWDVETQKAVSTLTGHSNYVFCVSYNPTGNILASGSFDESIKLWDLRSGQCSKTLPAHSDPVCSVDWNKDGSMLASSSYDGFLRLWDSASGSCLTTLISDNVSVSNCRWSPNGKFLLASTLNSTMKLWSPDGNALKTYQGHLNEKYSVFSVFGVDRVLERSYVLSGSEDNNAYVWDLQSKEILQILEDHTSPVIGIDYHPSQNMVITSSMGEDASVKIWHGRGVTQE